MMMNQKCYYFTEGQCEEKLIKALKMKPALIIPGKVRVFNVIQNKLPVSILMTIDPGSIAVLVFDTDVEKTEHLRKNIELLKKVCTNVEILTVAQVLNFEDEIERTTDVNKAQDLTKSKSIAEFKSAVSKMKEIEFRRALKRHNFNVAQLWIRRPQKSFAFLSQDGEVIKMTND